MLIIETVKLVIKTDKRKYKRCLEHKDDSRSFIYLIYQIDYWFLNNDFNIVKLDFISRQIFYDIISCSIECVCHTKSSQGMFQKKRRDLFLKQKQKKIIIFV